ncbi:DUF6896 domain-containing protein [Xanthocytophaga flava]|uniref:DUF6896 domain-containing protein n=1 Tax=Xanthocytophaga flava TaxID=3048013 RepID=UPI0028D0ACF9|nr:hypothetical protein [Xanthocytophaga flavus]MDJ1473811.1 hypothetical protein [Xanthocytophaga flavus]
MNISDEELNRLVDWIQLYISKVKEIDSTLKEKFKTTNPLADWCSRKVSQEGVFAINGKRAFYYFHGIGCRISIGKEQIDFNYGINGRIDGFDPWRISLFLRDKSDDPLSTLSEGEIQNRFDLLEDKDVIQKTARFPGWHLYYFK